MTESVSLVAPVEKKRVFNAPSLQSCAIAMLLLACLSACDFFRQAEPMKTEPSEKNWQDLLDGAILINGQTLDKKAVLEKMAGKTVFVNFWATWCPPCQAEMPGLFKLARLHSHQVAVIAVSQDHDLKDAKKWLALFPKANAADVFIISDEKRKWAQAFKISKIPETFVYDAQGKLIKKIDGAIDFESPEILEIISKKID